MRKEEKRAVIVNHRKAHFEYHLLDKFVAGVVLLGTEVKSVRLKKVSLVDTFCGFLNGELYLRNCIIQPYEKGGVYFNHDPKRDRKLLLNKSELKKLQNKLKDVGLTIVPIEVFFTEEGKVKVEIALAKGKKLYDKRATTKERDLSRKLQKRDYE